MIDLSNDQLTLSFPDTHLDARLVIEFHRTLRIPNTDLQLPRLPSLGRYPLYAVEEYRERVPSHWLESGTAMLPMYQSEAMWLSFRPLYSVAHQAFYPFAVKVRVGLFDAVRGGRWSEGLNRRRQDHLLIKEHSWLGGFQSGRGIRQFVAMPLGSGYLPENDPMRPDRFGHLEIVAYPMSASAFEMRFPRNRWQERLSEVPLSVPSPLTRNRPHDLGPDALERQRSEEGLFPFDDWDRESAVRCGLHLANSLHWCAIAGGPPPMSPTRIRPELARPIPADRASVPPEREFTVPPVDNPS